MAIKRDYKKSQLNQNFVAKNTKFRFRCTECGECCRNVEKEDKILLSAVDIYRAAKYLNLEVQTFIGMHCELVPGGESMLPLLVMKQRLDGSCTFLRKGKCTIHDAKPIPCSVFPLGRMLFLNDTTQEHDFHYYLEDFDCAAAKDTDVTVQEWLDLFEVEKYDECVKMYKRLGSVCSRLMHEAKTLEEQQEMFQTAFFLMYVKYVTDEPLLPQLMQNLAFVQSIHPENSFGKN